jgi:hypothetical protein
VLPCDDSYSAGSSSSHAALQRPKASHSTEVSPPSVGISVYGPALVVGPARQSLIQAMCQTGESPAINNRKVWSRVRKLPPHAKFWAPDVCQARGGVRREDDHRDTVLAEADLGLYGDSERTSWRCLAIVSAAPDVERTYDAMAPLSISPDGVLWRQLGVHVPRLLSCYLPNNDRPLTAVIIDSNSHPDLIGKVADLFSVRFGAPRDVFLWELEQFGTYALAIFEDETLKKVNAAAIFHVADFEEKAGKTCSGDVLLVVGWQATAGKKSLGGLGTLAFLSLCKVMLVDTGKDERGGLRRSVHLFMHSLDQARGFWQRLGKFDWHAGAILINVVESIGRAKHAYESLPAERRAEIDSSGREHLSFDPLCFECTCTMAIGSTEVPEVYRPAEHDSQALREVFCEYKPSPACDPLSVLRTENTARCNALQRSLEYAVDAAKVKLSDWLKSLLAGEEQFNHGKLFPKLDHPFIIYHQVHIPGAQSMRDRDLFGDWRFAEVLGYDKNEERHLVLYDRWLTGAVGFQHKKHKGKVLLESGSNLWSLVPFDLIKRCM